MVYGCCDRIFLWEYMCMEKLWSVSVNNVSVIVELISSHVFLILNHSVDFCLKIDGQPDYFAGLVTKEEVLLFKSVEK